MPPPSGENTACSPVSTSIAVTCEPKTWVTYSRPSGPSVIPLEPARRLGGVTTSNRHPAATSGTTCEYVDQRSPMSCMPFILPPPAFPRRSRAPPAQHANLRSDPGSDRSGPHPQRAWTVRSRRSAADRAPPAAAENRRVSESRSERGDRPAPIRSGRGRSGRGVRPQAGRRQPQPRHRRVSGVFAASEATQPAHPQRAWTVRSRRSAAGREAPASASTPPSERSLRSERGDSARSEATQRGARRLSPAG